VNKANMKNDKKLLIAGFAVSLFIAGFASYYASSSPDGLEKVAEDIGFIETAKENTNADTTLADYGVKGVDNERLSTGTAGVIGVLATAGVSTGLFLVLRRRSGAEK
jgi:cobalt/nickel transport protein